jgi:hypothetical protein
MLHVHNSCARLQKAHFNFNDSKYQNSNAKVVAIHVPKRNECYSKEKHITRNESLMGLYLYYRQLNSLYCFFSAVIKLKGAQVNKNIYYLKAIFVPSERLTFRLERKKPTFSRAPKVAQTLLCIGADTNRKLNDEDDTIRRPTPWQDIT